MGIFSRSPTAEQLDERLDGVTVENQILTQQKEIAEKEAIIKQLKQQYGPGWKKILGIGSHIDLQSLRTFLKASKQGLERAGGPRSNQLLSPISTSPVSKASTGSGISVLPPAGVRRA